MYISSSLWQHALQDAPIPAPHAAHFHHLPTVPVAPHPAGGPRHLPSLNGWIHPLESSSRRWSNWSRLKRFQRRRRAAKILLRWMSCLWRWFNERRPFCLCAETVRGACSQIPNLCSVYSVLSSWLLRNKLSSQSWSKHWSYHCYALNANFILQSSHNLQCK